MAPQPQQGAPPRAPPPAGAANPEDAKLQLATRRLQAGESLTALGEDLLRLTRLAYPRMDPASQDELARDRLLVEVEDTAARKRARMSSPATVAAALRAIRAVPDTSASTTPTPRPPPSAPSVADERCVCGGVAASVSGADARALASALRENTEAVRQLMEKLKAEPAAAAPSSRASGWRFF